MERKKLDKKIIFFWLVVRWNEDDARIPNKYVQIFFEEIGGEFSLNSIDMVVLNGDKVKGGRVKNHILMKSYNVSHSDDQYSVINIW